MEKETINVTKTFLPPISEYTDILNEAWLKNWITNGGSLVRRLINELTLFLDVPNLLLTTNGTIALQIAIKTLQLKGEIITTPFSYIATSSSIIWEGCTPVYVDIDQDSWTIDAQLIEDAITPKTTAILATHVFGNPCDIETISKIAKKYSLKVIYDAAHCFGVKYRGKSVLSYGDVSICSFHATKLFHTGEGGCVITKNKALHDRLIYHHNFGHNGEEDFHGLGINGKASELQAALGLAILPYMDSILAHRKAIVNLYNKLFEQSPIQLISIRNNTQWNYSYFPIVFKDEKDTIEAIKSLKKKNIIPRRYFYPSLNKIKYINGGRMPKSEDLASKILCLPIYYGLEHKTVKCIADTILEVIKK